MFLTYQFAPVWALLISMLTFLTLRYFDPVDLNEHKHKMSGVPPAACCLTVAMVLVVATVYELILKLGPKPSKVAIKV